MLDETTLLGCNRTSVTTAVCEMSSEERSLLKAFSRGREELGLLDAGFRRFLLTLSFGVFQLAVDRLSQNFFLRRTLRGSTATDFAVSMDRLSSLIKTAAAKTVVQRPSLLPTAD